jgi:uncharacterized membrane protein
MSDNLIPQIATFVLVIVGVILLWLDDMNIHFAIGYMSGALVVLFTILWMKVNRKR